MKSNYSLKLIEDDKGFKNLEKAWLDFEKSINHQNITSSYYWLLNFWDVFKNFNNPRFGYNKKLIIICVYVGKKIVAVAPFLRVKRKKLGISVSFIEFLGQQWGASYLDIITKKNNKEIKNIIFDWLKKNVKFDIIFLKYIPENTKSFDLNELNLYSACPLIQISDHLNYDDFVKNKYSKNLKQNLRTAYNRAKKFNFNIETSIELINEHNLPDVIRISKSKLLDGKRTLYENKEKLLFIKKILKSMDSNIVFVKIKGVNVAYRINVFFNNNKFCIDASYNRDYKKFELGSISVEANIKDSFSKNTYIHCLGPGLDRYKQKFTKKNKYVNIYISKGNTFISYPIIRLMKYLVIYKSKQFKIKLEK